MIACYRTIVVDPPWQLPNKARGFNGTSHWDTAGAGAVGKETGTPYAQMTLAEIAALPIPELAEDDAHLYLWTFARYIPDAYRLVAGWGFKPSSFLTWCKPPMGLGLGGGAFVATTEHVVFARRGREIRTKRWESTWIAAGRPYAQGPIHSAKPEAFLDIVEQVSPGPYLEMFARRARFGWDYWGDESLGTVELQSSGGTT
jgi:N6-adenosine-specific RNA methylase IME4